MATGTITPVATESVTLTVGTNSYISVADAVTYITNLYGGATWLALDSDEQAQTLISATKRIDGLRLKGQKVASTQALAFPRKFRDPVSSIWSTYLSGWIEGYTVQSAVPDDVTYAVCHEAVAMVNDDRGALAREGVVEYTIGSLHERLTGGRAHLASRDAMDYMRPYLAGAVPVV